MARKSAEIKVEMPAKDRIEEPLPAYFLSLTVENVRCFGPEQTLDLSDGQGCPAQWTIILGDNGVGKTTLLQSLVAPLPVENLDTLENANEERVVPRYHRYLQLNSEWKPYRYGNREGYLEISGALFTGAKLTELKGDGEVSVSIIIYHSGSYGFIPDEYR